MVFANNKTILWIVVANILVFLTLVLLVIPSINRIRELNHEMLERRVALERLYEQGQSTKKIASNLELIASLLPTLERAFLYRGEELAFITTMEAVAASHHLSHSLDFTTDKTKQPQREQEIEAIPVTLMIGGSYKNIFSFLTDIDRLPFYVSIKQISLTGDAPRNGFQMFGSRSAPSSIALGSEKNVFASIDAITYWREK